MAKTLAYGVPHADHLNEAASKYGVDPALMQGMLDFDGLDVFVLPGPAVEFALDFLRQYAGGAALQGSLADKDPRANIMAAAWFLAGVHELYGNEGRTLAEFYGGGPIAKLKAVRIIASTYERRRRQWS